jgi:hypothetical protein
MSCRFVVVTYESDKGNFDTIFTSQGGGDEFQVMNTAAGLFQWLSPTADSWDTGTCIGYTQSALNVISDSFFETARFMAVLAVVLGCFLLFWALALACISLGRFQIWLLAAGQLLLAVFVALFFLVHQSNLCHNIGQNTVCRVDEGGMMAVAAAILWGIGFLLTARFMRSPEKKRQELVEALAEDLADKIRKKAAEKRKRREQKEQQEAALAASFHEEAVEAVATHPEVKRSQAERLQASTPITVTSVEAVEAVATHPEVKRSQAEQLQASTPVTVPSVEEGQDGELEVYISGQLDKIGRILDEEESL